MYLFSLQNDYILLATAVTTLLYHNNHYTIYRVHIISVSYEIYGYLPISPIGGVKVKIIYIEIVKGVKSIYILESK